VGSRVKSNFKALIVIALLLGIFLASSVRLADSETPAVYWSANFESGNFFEITNNGGGQVQRDAGASSVLITSNVFNGSYALNSSVNIAPGGGNIHSKVVRWSPIRDLSVAYYGAALYLPFDFDVSSNYGASWVNIMQLHTLDGAYALPACLIMTKSHGQIEMTLYSKSWDNLEHVYWNGPSIIGEWFTVVFYCEFKENGNLTLWINNVQVASVIGDFRTGDSYNGPFFDTGIYQDYTSPAQYVLSDDMIVASTLELATPTGTPTITPTPSPTPTPTPTAIPTPVPSPTPTPTPTAIPTPVPSPTPTPTPTAIPTPAPSPTPTPTAINTPTPRPTPTLTPTPNPSPSSSLTPSQTPAPTPTSTLTPSPAPTPTPTQTASTTPAAVNQVGTASITLTAIYVLAVTVATSVAVLFIRKRKIRYYPVLCQWGRAVKSRVMMRKETLREIFDFLWLPIFIIGLIFIVFIARAAQISHKLYRTLLRLRDPGAPPRKSN
jgi:hypothetical protein